MRKTPVFFITCIALAILIVGPASAGSPKRLSCSGGAIAAGSYAGLTVTGTCTIASAVTINGSVKVANGAYLDAAYDGTRLTINGNVDVGKGAKLGLGCTFGYHDCGVSFPPPWFGRVTVNGNIVANRALDDVPRLHHHPRQRRLERRR